MNSFAEEVTARRCQRMRHFAADSCANIHACLPEGTVLVQLFLARPTNHPVPARYPRDAGTDLVNPT